jgi:mono/diheme cytochrome c family protein
VKSTGQLPMKRFTLNTRRVILAAASAVLLISAALAQTAPTESSLREDPVYHKNCAKCHGKTAEGRFMGGPSLLGDNVKAMSSEDLRTLIMNGKKNSGRGKMPAFSGLLTPEALDNLVAEIKVAQKPQGSKESGQEQPSTHEGPTN